LQQGLAALNSGATTGPGAPTLEKYGALAAELTGLPSNQATQTQLLDKSSSWLLQNSLKGLGVPTDGKMAAVAIGNPNSKMTPGALRAAVAFKMGGLDYKQAENSAWQEYQQANGASADFSKFVSQWNTQYQTTNVFALPYLSEPEQVRVLKAMTAKECSDFVGALNSAMAKGWVQMPSVFAQKAK
ncbi:MAG TPA: hypothetical protein PLY97_11550, partial [Acidocella sp.]|nr:hypothetical protein [Acidocella sp.]